MVLHSENFSIKDNNPVDFTLQKYSKIMDSAQEAGYQLRTLGGWFKDHKPSNGNGNGSGQQESQDPVFLVRHDVDRHPQRALAMAQLEAKKNIAASYYFRAVPCSFKPDIIREIADLGHEIGYHYEDWFLAKYDREQAIRLYRKHLAELREIAPVATIAMHGSPLAKESNLAIWEHYDLCQEGVKDVIRSADFSKYAFFTDTGRTFGQSKANLRDFVGSETIFEDVWTSDDLIAFLQDKQHKQVYFSVHPERWTDQILGWSGQFAKDKIVNGIKLGIKLVR